MPITSLTAKLAVHFDISDRLDPERIKDALDCLLEAIDKIREQGAVTVLELDIRTLPLPSERADFTEGS